MIDHVDTDLRISKLDSTYSITPVETKSSESF